MWPFARATVRAVRPPLSGKARDMALPPPAQMIAGRRRKREAPPVDSPMEVGRGTKQRKAPGRNRSLMRPAAWVAERHPFGATLKEWEQGVPVHCGPDWAREAIEEAVLRGPHVSAMTPEARALVLEDVLYQVEAGFSEIVLWDDIKDDLPSQLKVSPLAVIPQKDRRGRLILDLSFGVRGSYGPKKGQVIQASVNDTTTRLSPLKPIQELGKVLPRLLDFMATTPDGETVQFSKIDLSDGFWRMIVNKKDCWNFAYVLPDAPGSPTRLVVPHALQMGWTESPGYFCAATETGRDLMQALIDSEVEMPAHPLEEYMLPTEHDPG